MQTFVNSTEYRTHFIAATYETYLMRAPSTQEIALWLPLLSEPSAGAGKPNQDQIFTSIVLGSAEYFLNPCERGSNGLLSNQQWLTTLYDRNIGPRSGHHWPQRPANLAAQRLPAAAAGSGYDDGYQHGVP